MTSIPVVSLRKSLARNCYRPDAIPDVKATPLNLPIDINHVIFYVQLSESLLLNVCKICSTLQYFYLLKSL